MRIKQSCATEDCYFARVGYQHDPAECVSTAEVEAIVASAVSIDAPCAGCGIALADHAMSAHRWFERWGEQDETWEASLN